MSANRNYRALNTEIEIKLDFREFGVKLYWSKHVLFALDLRKVDRMSKEKLG